MNNEIKELSELLRSLMEERGISAEKLSYSSNIPHRFIVALLEGDLKGLPARPYVRGYLLKIAVALNIDAALLLKAHKDASEIKSSGEEDRLPINKFAIERINKNLAIVFIVIILVVGFLSFRIKDILGTPTVEIGLPENTLVVQEKIIKINGRINPRDRLTLNQEIVYTDEAGKFEKETSLSPGLNTFEFNVKRFLGRETKVVRQIFYEEPANIQPTL